MLPLTVVGGIILWAQHVLCNACLRLCVMDIIIPTDHASGKYNRLNAIG
jgi:hypothetical protein